MTHTNSLNTRESYTESDKVDREAHLGSRNNVLHKSFITDLWMKVLNRAIDDIVMFTVMRDDDTELKEEELEAEQTAHSFLFDPEYRIPMDDYFIDILCANCEGSTYRDRMSILSSGYSKCPQCGETQGDKVQYSISEQRLRDVSLKELLEMWNIDNVEEFRVGAKARINELVEKKKVSIQHKKKQKKEKKKMVTEENFKMPSEEELTDFDKAIIKVLDESKEMLMQKNRKYGNSATKPVRAFSKADPVEQIKVRIDDKISRLVRSGTTQEDEDVPQDLHGYLTILIAIQKGYLK